jgi:hypothetical protein
LARLVQRDAYFLYRPSENWWFIEGEPDFVWGWDGANFMPITSQINVYNWVRFVMGRFSDFLNLPTFSD